MCTTIYGYSRGLHSDKKELRNNLKLQSDWIEAYKKRLMQFDKTLIDGGNFCDIRRPHRKERFRSLPAARQMLAKLVPGDHIVISDFTFAFQSFKKCLQNLALWKKQKIHVHFAREKTAINSPAGLFLTQILRHSMEANRRRFLPLDTRRKSGVNLRFCPKCHLL